jgi:hypothetical protein
VKRPLFIISVLALAAALFTAAPAGAGLAGPQGNVTLVHALTFDAGTNIPVSVCVDDQVLLEEFNTTDIVGPVPLEVGTYNVEIFDPPQADCAGTPDLQADLTIGDGDDITVMAYLPVSGPALAVFDNDTSCVDPGNGRVTARHGAAPSPVNVRAGGAVVISNLASGEEAVLDIPAGSYSEVDVVRSADGEVVLDVGTVNVPEAANLVIYVYGGSDGEVGYFTDEIPLVVCEQPTTTTTTTTAAPVARPAFTG